MACKDAEDTFQPFIPNGKCNPVLNYILDIKSSQKEQGGTFHTIIITINRLDGGDGNDTIEGIVNVARTEKGLSIGYVSSLQVGNWITGEKSDILKGKRIGYFILLIFLYISRRLNVYMIELEDMSQIPDYYDFMGFISYKPEFTPEELTRYYKDDIAWRKDVNKILNLLYEKNNNANASVWNWCINDETELSKQKILEPTLLHLPGSHGMRGGRKRRFKKHKTKRRTKKRKTKRRKTKKRRKSRRRKYN